jgi:hypothetical protein
MSEYQCPNCKSGYILQQGLDLVCQDCGRHEPLYDYPMSWDWYRGLRQSAGLSDPGPARIVNSQIDNIEARVTFLEDIEEYPNHELQQLKALVLHLQNNVSVLNKDIRTIKGIGGKGGKGNSVSHARPETYDNVKDVY